MIDAENWIAGSDHGIPNQVQKELLTLLATQFPEEVQARYELEQSAPRVMAGMPVLQMGRMVDRFYISTERPDQLGGFAAFAVALWHEAPPGQPPAASIIIAFSALLLRVRPLTQQERKLVLAWAEMLGQQLMYSTALSVEDLAQLVGPGIDVAGALDDLERKGVARKRGGGYVLCK